ncbi:MAG: T9SS type A sorting domain-containing protein [Bacteroidetes bacterium]|nr:MAG: T9SS type A sorting domain-containing protein [Bacteroidota bacterium]
MKQLLSLCLSPLALLSMSSLSAQFNPDSLFHIEVQGNDTDPLIILDGLKKNQVFYNPSGPSQNTLLLHLVGTIDNPNSTILYPSAVANRGFHCINLAYRNATSAQSACGAVPDTNCHLNFRKEIIEGVNYSSETNVNSSNSIENRLLKLLQYLHANYPLQNWGQFYNGETLLWEKMMVSGHSQGGGHAAVIGMTHALQRVIMFASPNDYIDTLKMVAPWSKQAHITADSNFFSFNALYDEVSDFGVQYAHSQSLGQATFGDSVLVDQSSFPYEHSRQLYTKQEVQSGNPLLFTHDIVVRDAETPVDGSGKPEFKCAWLYMLGLKCDSELSSPEIAGIRDFKVYPNPFQDVLSVSSVKGSTNCQLRLLDLCGNILVQKEMSPNKRMDLPTAEIKPGCYLLQMVQGNQILLTRKVIKL